MIEIEENKESKEVAKPTTEHLAMEVLKGERDKHKAKNVGVIGLTVAVVVIAVGMAVINYRNDCDWRRLFSSYDYITQDGGGYNNVNSGQQGDLNNGSKSENEKE